MIGDLYMTPQISFLIRRFLRHAFQATLPVCMAMLCCVSNALAEKTSAKAVSVATTDPQPTALTDPPLAAKPSFQEIHVLHVKLLAEVDALKVQLPMLANTSAANQAALIKARETTLTDPAIAKMAAEIRELHAELDVMLESAPGVAALIADRAALKTELASTTRLRQETMLQMQKEGITDERRDIMTNTAKQASDAQGRIARLAIAIEAKQVTARAEDKKTAALSAKIVEQEHQMHAAVRAVPAVGALEAERETILKKTRELTEKMAALDKEIKHFACCRNKDL
ncbi:MAG: hypothetical protein ACI9OU_001737 [Candidatus Promineifilaceae bacterium]|jgi:hypothetical protein